MTQAQPGADRTQKPEAMVGRVFGGSYRLTRVLGTGGMGSVYEAVHVGFGQPRAIKLLAPHLSRDLKLVARFRREAMAAAKIEHENCVRVYEFGEDNDGTFFIAMELIPGRGLADELRAAGPMSVERVARVGIQLLKALDAAHHAHVLHRDLKPQNVMIMQKPRRPDLVKVVDFGIAKITQNSPEDQGALTVPGTIFGTPEYMSPEQARGEVLDERSDLYSAAVVLWHMMLGRSPFRGATVRDTLLKVFAEEAPSPSVERPGAGIPAAFEAVLRRALTKRKEDRYDDAATFLDAMRPWAGDLSVDVPRRARPGLAVDGQAPPETLEAAPAVSASPAASARTPAASSSGAPAHALPRAASPAPMTSPATQQDTRFAPPSALGLASGAPLSSAPSASPLAGPTSTLAGPHDDVAPAVPVVSAAQPPRHRPSPLAITMTRPAGLPDVPPPVASTPPSPIAAVAASSPPSAQDGAPPMTPRVLTLDGARRKLSGPAPIAVAPAPDPPPRRRTSPMSTNAIVVAVVGALALVGFGALASALLRRDSSSSPMSSDGAPPAGAHAAGDAAPTTPHGASTTDKPAPSRLVQLLETPRPLDPMARDAALGRAERAVTEGRTDDARAAYEDAIVNDPTTAKALAGLGTIAMQQHDWAMARDCFERLMDLGPQYERRFGPMHARAKKLAEQAVP